MDIERLERVMAKIEEDPFVWFQGWCAVLKRVKHPRPRYKTAYNFAALVLLDAGYEFVGKGEGPKNGFYGFTIIDPFVFVRPDGTEIGWGDVDEEARAVLGVPDTTGYYLFAKTMKSNPKQMRKYVDEVLASEAVQAAG